jgi:putative spermidine/putrescine transport system substrate-binding protein
MTNSITRRPLLSSGAMLAVSTALPTLRAAADSKNLVVATYPGTWAEAHRQILQPAFTNRTGATVSQSIILGVDQLSRLTAAKGGKPPFDVALLDTPQVSDAVKQGIIVEYPVSGSPNYKYLLPAFQDKWGPRVSMQVVGIGYNPGKIKTPPASWEALWDPQYKGRVGLTALNSQLGIAFLAEINRLHGGTEDNFDPAFKALKQLLPNVGAIGVNLGAYATLWQQEQIDIAPYNFNFVQTLKAKDVPVELSIPASGAIGWYTSMHLTANAAEPELATAYIDTALDAGVEAAMAKPPFDVIPANSQVALPASVTASIAKTVADLAKIRSFDWEKINPQRGELIDRFNREIKL